MSPTLCSQQQLSSSGFWELRGIFLIRRMFPSSESSSKGKTHSLDCLFSQPFHVFFDSHLDPRCLLEDWLHKQTVFQLIQLVLLPLNRTSVVAILVFNSRLFFILLQLLLSETDLGLILQPKRIWGFIWSRFFAKSFCFGISIILQLQ